MKPFQMKDLGDISKRPSLDSVIAHKRRQASIAKNQENIHADSLLGSQEEGVSTHGMDLTTEFGRNDTYTETEEKLMADMRNMSLVGHLSELRGRLIGSIIAIMVGSIIAYYYADAILAVITAPAGKLYYLRPTEAFFTYMKLAFVGGVILSSPVWIYQIWAFVIPALTTREKKLTLFIVPVAICLFLIGIAFSYFFVLPAAIQFFIGFSTDSLQPLLSIGQYIDFVIAFIIPFGIIFELPLLLIALSVLGILTSEQLGKWRKLFILVSFIVGGAISPTPDMFSQTMIALPMILLYEISYRIIRHMLKK